MDHPKPDRRKPQRSGLGPKQSAFVAEYLVDLNAKQAAIRAGYSEASAEQQGSALLSNPKVQAAVSEAMGRRAKRVELKQDDVIRELMRIGLCDPGKAFSEDGDLLPIHKMPEEARRAVSGIDIEEIYAQGEPIGRIKKLRFWDKVKGLELLGKNLKLFVEKHELAGAGGETLGITINIGAAK